MELCTSDTQHVILQDATASIFRNETVRFLPAISETFQYHSELEKVVEECSKPRNDECNGEQIDIINNDFSDYFYEVIITRCLQFLCRRILEYITYPYFFAYFS